MFLCFCLGKKIADDFRAEIRTLSVPNTFKCFFFSVCKHFVLFQHCLLALISSFTSGSCRDVIAVEFKHGLPFLVVGMILRSVLIALEYLHGMGYVHRYIHYYRRLCIVRIVQLLTVGSS